MGLISEALAQILIPAAALIGIGFALVQWFLVSKVNLVPDRNNNGFRDQLIDGDEREEGIDAAEVVNKCSEIQNAISEGENFSSFTSLSLPLSMNFDSCFFFCHLHSSNPNSFLN